MGGANSENQAAQQQEGMHLSLWIQLSDGKSRCQRFAFSRPLKVSLFFPSSYKSLNLLLSFVSSLLFPPRFRSFPLAVSGPLRLTLLQSNPFP